MQAICGIAVDDVTQASEQHGEGDQALLAVDDFEGRWAVRLPVEQHGAEKARQRLLTRGCFEGAYDGVEQVQRVLALPGVFPLIMGDDIVRSGAEKLGK